MKKRVQDTLMTIGLILIVVLTLLSIWRIAIGIKLDKDVGKLVEQYERVGDRYEAILEVIEEKTK